MPPIVTRVDGEPRRICDMIAAHPWAIQHHRPAGFYRIPTATIKETNVRVAEGLLKGRTTVLFADEVADELRWSQETSTTAWCETPGAMPPFPQLLVEARTGAEKVGNDFVGVGVLAYTIDLDDPTHPVIAIMDQKGVAEDFLKLVREERRSEVRAVVLAHVWIQRADGSVWGPITEMAYAITRQFRVMLCERPDDWLDPQGRDVRAIGKPIVMMQPVSTIPAYTGPDARFIAEATHLAGAVFVRACGMMNASNVKFVEGGHTNDSRSATVRAEKRLAWIKYHVLKLKVGTELRPLPVRRGTERPDPMRLVRGHFKDFSEKGLFGKYKGTKYAHVWCPAFVRGSVEDGVVVKDYAVENDA